jgi:hypothetical protein
MLVTTAAIPLTRLDRCDRCGAAAKTRATLPSGGELLFCDHHTHKYADRLRQLEAGLQRSPSSSLTD